MNTLHSREIGLKILFWAPRILGIVFILFLAIFALDVFESGKSVGYYLVALFMHLIPNFILAALLFIAWKHEKIGGICFILIALCFTFFFKTYVNLMSFFIVSFPLFLIGFLFLAYNKLKEDSDMKKTSVFICAGLCFLIIAISIVFLWQRKQGLPSDKISKTTVNQNVPSSTTTLIPSQLSNENAHIIVSSPKVYQHISLPIVIKGTARVFENQFNYRVRDVDGVILFEGSAYANSPDIGQYGEFEIHINSLPTMRANTITLEVFDYSAKDGKEIDTVSLPVIFDPSNSIPITVYFGGRQALAGQECTTVYPIEHHINKTQATARAALEELLKGPMTIESKKGYSTSINDGVEIQKLVIEKGIAKVDFNKRLEEGVGGSCKVMSIRTQITQTLKQFPTVKDVVISIDGRTEDILQP